MGKHADRPNLAQNIRLGLDAVRELRSKKSAEPRRGAHASEESLTLSSQASPGRQLFSSLKHRPVLTAVTVPAVAAIVLAGGGLVAAPHLGVSPTPEVVAQEGLDRDGQEASRSAEREAEEEVVDPDYAKAMAEAEEAAKEGPGDPKQKKSESPSSGSGGDSSSSGGSSKDVSGAPCSVSASIESGLTANAVKGYRAVCAEFPEVKSYGGRRNDPGSDHNSGQAVDIMITGATGDRIAQYLIDNSSELNVKYVIWSQKIWMPGRGWKAMSDRGGATANHYDHVHLSVN